MLVADVTNEESRASWGSHSVRLDVATDGVKQLDVGGAVRNDEKNVQVEEEGCSLDKCIICPLSVLQHIVTVDRSAWSWMTLSCQLALLLLKVSLHLLDSRVVCSVQYKLLYIPF